MGAALGRGIKIKKYKSATQRCIIEVRKPGTKTYTTEKILAIDLLLVSWITPIVIR
jgi:hypothetical protein